MARSPAKRLSNPVAHKPIEPSPFDRGVVGPQRPPPPPPPPTVAPAGLDGLLPSLQDLGNIIGYTNLRAEEPIRQFEPIDPHPTAAQTQSTNLQSAWRRCDGSPVNATYADIGREVLFSMGLPADAGGGVVTLEVVSLPVHFVRAIAAKTNVFVEVRASSVATDHARQVALDVVSYVLYKIRG